MTSVRTCYQRQRRYVFDYIDVLNSWKRQFVRISIHCNHSRRRPASRKKKDSSRFVSLPLSSVLRIRRGLRRRSSAIGPTDPLPLTLSPSTHRPYQLPRPTLGLSATCPTKHDAVAWRKPARRKRLSVWRIGSVSTEILSPYAKSISWYSNEG